MRLIGESEVLMDQKTPVLTVFPLLPLLGLKNPVFQYYAPRIQDPTPDTLVPYVKN